MSPITPAPQGQYRGIAIHFLATSASNTHPAVCSVLVRLAVRQYAFGDPLGGEGVRPFARYSCATVVLVHDQQIPGCGCALSEQLAVRQQLSRFKMG